jgi:hypothetical protein
MLSRFQGTLMGILAADALDTAQLPQERKPSSLGEAQDIARTLDLNRTPINSMPPRANDEDEIEHWIARGLSAIIPADALPDPKVGRFNPDRVIKTRSGSSLADERELQAEPLQPLPLVSSISMIPFVLYTYRETFEPEVLTRCIHSLEGSAPSSIRFPLSSVDRAVAYTLTAVLNQTFSAKTFMSDLIDYMEENDSVLVRVLRSVDDACCNRRGAFWLLNALEIIHTDVLGSSASERDNARAGQSTMAGHSQTDYSSTSSTKEAIAMGLVFYVLCSTPTQYNTAMRRLKHLVQQSVLGDRFRAPTCSVLGAIIGSYIGGQAFLPLIQPQGPSEYGGSEYGGSEYGGYPARAPTSPMSSHNASLSVMGKALWALWSGVDRCRLKSLLRDIPEWSGLTTATPGIIRRFGN